MLIFFRNLHWVKVYSQIFIFSKAYIAHIVINTLQVQKEVKIF